MITGWRKFPLELDEVAVLVDAEKEDEVVVGVPMEDSGQSGFLVCLKALPVDNELHGESPVNNVVVVIGSRGGGPHVDVSVAFVFVEEEHDPLHAA